MQETSKYKILIKRLLRLRASFEYEYARIYFDNYFGDLTTDENTISLKTFANGVKTSILLDNLYKNIKEKTLNLDKLSPKFKYHPDMDITDYYKGILKSLEDNSSNLLQYDNFYQMPLKLSNIFSEMVLNKMDTEYLKVLESYTFEDILKYAFKNKSIWISRRATSQGINPNVIITIKLTDLDVDKSFKDTGILAKVIGKTDRIELRFNLNKKETITAIEDIINKKIYSEEIIKSFLEILNKNDFFEIHYELPSLRSTSNIDYHILSMMNTPEKYMISTLTGEVIGVNYPKIADSSFQRLQLNHDFQNFKINVRISLEKFGIVNPKNLIGRIQEKRILAFELLAYNIKRLEYLYSKPIFPSNFSLGETVEISFLAYNQYVINYLNNYLTRLKEDIEITPFKHPLLDYPDFESEATPDISGIPASNIWKLLISIKPDIFIDTRTIFNFMKWMGKYNSEAKYFRIIIGVVNAYKIPNSKVFEFGMVATILNKIGVVSDSKVKHLLRYRRIVKAFSSSFIDIYTLEYFTDSQSKVIPNYSKHIFASDLNIFMAKIANVLYQYRENSSKYFPNNEFSDEYISHVDSTIDKIASIPTTHSRFYLSLLYNLHSEYFSRLNHADNMDFKDNWLEVSLPKKEKTISPKYIKYFAFPFGLNPDNPYITQTEMIYRLLLENKRIPFFIEFHYYHENNIDFILKDFKLKFEIHNDINFFNAFSINVISEPVTVIKINDYPLKLYFDRIFYKMIPDFYYLENNNLDSINNIITLAKNGIPKERYNPYIMELSKNGKFDNFTDNEIDRDAYKKAAFKRVLQKIIEWNLKKMMQSGNFEYPEELFNDIINGYSNDIEGAINIFFPKIYKLAENIMEIIDYGEIKYLGKEIQDKLEELEEVRKMKLKGVL